MWTLYYDGGCNLCHASKLRAEKWAERSGQALRVDVLQGSDAIAKGYVGDAMVLEADQVYTGAEAWLKLMEISPWYLRWISSAGKLPGAKQLLTWGYGLVARIRYKVFGTRACQIPPRS